MGALKGLDALAQELVENSGIKGPIGNSLNSHLENLLPSVGSVLLTGLLMLTSCVGWCMAPCLRHLLASTLSKMFSSDVCADGHKEVS